MNKNRLRNFIAVDFETATSSRMACQIGITVVEDRKIKETVCQLIQPPGNKYDNNCVKVHGITPRMTAGAPTFDKVWKVIAPYFDEYPVVMHNKEFDDDVLEKNLEHYGIDYPDMLPFFCTYEIFGQALDVVCAAYHLPTDGHHDAGCDAEMCARIFLKYLDTAMPDNDAATAYYNKKRKEKSEPEYHERIQGDLLKKDLTNADPSGMFYDKKVVVTGVFPVERKQLATALKNAGADIDTNVSPRTDYVLVGEDAGWRKLETIDELNAKGAGIKILRWDDFHTQLGNL